MNTGTTVYLSWYDFAHKAEYVCKGEVVDNILWAGTQWQGYVNVLFQPPHSAGSFCHHFTEDKLALTPDNVPHDDCYLVCGKKTRSYEHDHTILPHSASDAWQQVQQFKQEHWDYTHGHLSVDALDEYYTMWRDAIAAKRGFKETILPPYSEITSPYSQISAPYHQEPQPAQKLSRKQLHSTSAITFKDSIQTSIFD